jgi:hypothetical protein
MAWRATDDADGGRRRHGIGVPRPTNAVGATPGAPRPRPAIIRHATPPFSDFHQYSLVKSRPRSELTQIRKKNHPAPSF